jgi:UDP-glucose 4-epimerase
MRVAVSGASGFIGRAFCTALHAAGHELVQLRLRNEGLPSATSMDAVVHLAAIAHRRGVSQRDLQRVNVDLARSVGEWAAAAGMRMVFVSSVKVHGEEGRFSESSPFNPGDGYAESKARAEEALRAVADLRLTVLRPPLVYGPCVKANFLSLMLAVARGWPLPLAGIANRRSLLYVDNLADAILHCLASPAGATYLVSDGLSLSTPELCGRLGHALGRPARLFRFPTRLLPAKLTTSLEVDDTAIRKGLGWTPPFSVDEGLRLTAEWYKAR